MVELMAMEKKIDSSSFVLVLILILILHL